MVILIASVYIKDKNYYPQLFLEKCECCQKKRYVILFTDNIGIHSDDSDDSDEKTGMKEIKYTNLFLKETGIIW